MFPTFKSLNDRSRKLHRLIDRLTLESNIDKEKEEMYSNGFVDPSTFSLDETDKTKLLNSNNLVSVGAQTDTSFPPYAGPNVGPNAGPNASPPNSNVSMSSSSSFNLNNLPRLPVSRSVSDVSMSSIFDTSPVMVDSGMNTTNPDMVDRSIWVSPSTTTRGIMAQPTMKERGMLAQPTMIDRNLMTDIPFRSEGDKMFEEDLRGHVMRLKRSENELMFDEDIRSHVMRLKRDIDVLAHDTTTSFEQMVGQFNELSDSETLTKTQLRALYNDFERGRIMFLQLQKAHEELTHRHAVSEHELNEMRQRYALGEETFIALQDAYKMLEIDSQIAIEKRALAVSEEYDKIIKALDAVNAIKTAEVVKYKAQLLEQQEQMRGMTVSETVSKNTRSKSNTPAQLRKYMVNLGKEQIPAASPNGVVSRKIFFEIRNGHLFKIHEGKPDIDLENETPEAKAACRGIDFVWSMVAAKHGLEIGTEMLKSKNKIYKEEADALRQTGKLQTHKDAATDDQSRPKQRVIDEELPTYEDMLMDDALSSKQRKALPSLQNPLAKERNQLPALHDAFSPISHRPVSSRSFAASRTPPTSNSSAVALTPENQIVKYGDLTKRHRTPSFYTTMTPPNSGEHKKNKQPTTYPFAGKGLPRQLGKRVNIHAKALKFRPIGAGMISLESLRKNKLSLRRARNTKAMLGKVKDISTDLQAVIKVLVYDGRIDDKAYKKLSMSDKEEFDDLLNKTGLVYTQKDWTNPKEALKNDYYKLVGEIELNNDSPEIKVELKKVLASMLACGMIKEPKYNEILSLL